MNLEVFIFVGTDENCRKIHNMTELFASLQISHPELPIEPFIVPIPRDEQAAVRMHRNIIENVNHLFANAYPSSEEMN